MHFAYLCVNAKCIIIFCVANRVANSALQIPFDLSQRQVFWRYSVESFSEARGVVGFIKALVFVGIAGCVLVFMLRINYLGVGLSLLSVVPFVFALAVQYLLCELARAMFTIAEATQGARKDASEANAISRADFAGLRSDLDVARGTGEPTPKTIDAAGPKPHSRRAEVSPAPTSKTQSDPNERVPANKPLPSHYNGHEIRRTNKGYFAVGPQGFVDERAARVAINRGDFD